MTSTTFITAPSSPSRSAARRRVHSPVHRPGPNYVLRRVVVGAVAIVAAAVVIAVLVAVLAGFGGVPAVASEATPASAAAAVVARPGDTLWSIAAEHRGEIGQRRYVDALVELNGGASIIAGQAIRLP